MLCSDGWRRYWPGPVLLGEKAGIGIVQAGGLGVVDDGRRRRRGEKMAQPCNIVSAAAAAAESNKGVQSRLPVLTTADRLLVPGSRGWCKILGRSGDRRSGRLGRTGRCYVYVIVSEEIVGGEVCLRPGASKLTRPWRSPRGDSPRAYSRRISNDADPRKSGADRHGEHKRRNHPGRALQTTER